MPPSELLAPLAALGLPGIVIGLLIWALVRKDKQVETLQEKRVADTKERAADNLRAVATLDQMTQATRAREEASDARWRVMETIGENVKQTARAIEVQAAHTAEAMRTQDANSMRLERIETLVDRGLHGERP